MSLKQLTNLARRQWTELVDKADAGVKLRITSQVLFNAGHTDQNHSDPALIKNAPCLLQTSHFEPVGFVYDQQRGRIRDQGCYPHRTMALLEIGIFSGLCLLAAISIWVLKTITQVIENAQKPMHFRILNLTPHINGGAVQPVSKLSNLPLNDARSADHRGGVENSGTGRYILNYCCIMAGTIPEVLHPVPVGVVPGRHRLADAGRAVAKADVSIALARITELCESAVFEGFEGFDYGGAGRAATRFCIA